MRIIFFRFSATLVLSVLSVLSQAAAPLTATQQAWLNRAFRLEKHGWIYVHLEGAPRERGFQHGYLLAKECMVSLKTTKASWEYQSAMPWPWLVKKADTMFTPGIDPENLAELEGLVEGLQAAGVVSSRAEMIAYNAYLELSGYWWPQELKKLKDSPLPPVRQSCSSFIATGSMTADGGVVLGHNTMQSYYDSWPNVIADVAPDKGHRILMQTSPCWIHSGTDFFITDAGLVGSETTIGGFDGFDTNGIPEFVRMRRATQDAGSIEAWCAIMKQGNNGGYANAWLVGDVNSGEIARLELGLKFIGFEKKRDGYFFGSNVAENMQLLRFETTRDETDIRASAIARRVRWKQLMGQYAGHIDLPLAKRFEGDHYDTYLLKNLPSGRGLCGHFELDREPAGSWPGVPFGPAGTIDAKVVDAKMAKRMAFAARWGSACGRAFDAPKFLAAHPQFDWMKAILVSRPAQPWTEFTVNEKPAK